MVGTESRKINLSELTGRYVGKSWQDYSCIKLMHDFYDDLGVDVPDQYAGIGLSDAIKKWRDHPRYAISRMISLFRHLGSASNTKDPDRYDLLVIRRMQEVFPGIYLGSSKFMTSTLQEGVVIGIIGNLNRPILARRLL